MKIESIDVNTNTVNLLHDAIRNQKDIATAFNKRYTRFEEGAKC